jgi:hypothetical protein
MTLTSSVSVDTSMTIATSAVLPAWMARSFWMTVFNLGAEAVTVTNPAGTPFIRKCPFRFV